MDQTFVPANSNGRRGLVIMPQNNGSGETNAQMFMGEEDAEPVQEDFEEEMGGSLDKPSLTAKLHEMERDVVALKRVLAFM